ncbi:unnamed protein product, partial [Ixodes persulcatus]
EVGGTVTLFLFLHYFLLVFIPSPPSLSRVSIPNFSFAPGREEKRKPAVVPSTLDAASDPLLALTCPRIGRALRLSIWAIVIGWLAGDDIASARCSELSSNFLSDERREESPKTRAVGRVCCPLHARVDMKLHFSLW